MKINICASHRFHLLDLARELSKQGHDVRFYSYIPSKRCARFCIDERLCCSLLWLVWPFFVLAKIAPRRWQDDIVWYRNLLLDWFLSKTMRRCDVCIGIGTVYFKVFLAAKRNGALTILEWGSKHIIEQQRQYGTLQHYHAKTLRRELLQYDICDYISIPSEHVKDSFLDHGVSETKLYVNPYGVDLSQFHPTVCTGEFDIVYVGGWRYEKGCDLLAALCKQYGYTLLHVGALVNMDFPDVANMVHHEPVDQKELINYYQRAKIFVLPSRSEGLAMVQAQAIACGLPIVCTKYTGGVDLKKLLNNSKWIVECDAITVQSLQHAIAEALDLAATQDSERNYAGEYIQELSWKRYGANYSTFLGSCK